MNWAEIYLICFGIGTLWALISLLLGGVHLGHFGHAHGHVHTGAHSHQHAAPGWLASFLNPSCLAVFLAWFGGVGYLLTKYSGLVLWINLALAVNTGLAGAWILAAFLRWLTSHERPMLAADFDMVGVLGRVSSTIRADGVGEFLYLQDGVRRLASARSETGVPIQRDEEVIVTRFEKGIAYVRTWDSMTQSAGRLQMPDSSKKEN